MADWVGTALANDRMFITPAYIRPIYGDRVGYLYSGGRMSGTHVHGGASAWLLEGGETFTTNVGCDAGSRTITFWVYPESADAKVRGEVYDPDTMALLASAVNSGDGSMQQISLPFTAEKKVYFLRIVNYSSRTDVAKRAWIDDLGVS